MIYLSRCRPRRFVYCYHSARCEQVGLFAERVGMLRQPGSKKNIKEAITFTLNHNSKIYQRYNFFKIPLICIIKKVIRFAINI